MCRNYSSESHPSILASHRTSKILKYNAFVVYFKISSRSSASFGNLWAISSTRSCSISLVPLQFDGLPISILQLIPEKRGLLHHELIIVALSVTNARSTREEIKDLPGLGEAKYVLVKWSIRYPWNSRKHTCALFALAIEFIISKRSSLVRASRNICEAKHKTCADLRKVIPKLGSWINHGDPPTQESSNNLRISANDLGLNSYSWVYYDRQSIIFTF